MIHDQFSSVPDKDERWRLRHPEQWKAINAKSTKVWRANNLEHYKQYHKEWRAANPDKVAKYKSYRRVANPIPFSVAGRRGYEVAIKRYPNFHSLGGVAVHQKYKLVQREAVILDVKSNQ